MKKIVGKIILFLFGGIIVIVSLWYFLGDNLFFLFLKNNSNIEICHESCMYDRTILENSLLFLTKHRPWLKNKILKNILNQKQPGEYRVLLLDIYRKIANPQKEDISKKINHLLLEEKTPSILKQEIFFQMKNDRNRKILCNSSYIRMYKKEIFRPIEQVEEEKIIEERNLKSQFIKQISLCLGEKSINLLVEIMKYDQGSLGYEASIQLASVLKGKLLNKDLILKLKQLIYNKKIHPELRENILKIFFYYPDKNFSKLFLKKIYNDPDILVYLKVISGDLLNNLLGKKIYPTSSLIPKQNWQKIINNTSIIFEDHPWYKSEKDWLKRVFPTRYE